MSAFYPPKMCQRVAKLVEQLRLHAETEIYAATTSPDYDAESLKQFTDQELRKVANELLALHKKPGHSGTQTFVKMLCDRGAFTMVRTIATNLHCMGCEEAAIRWLCTYVESWKAPDLAASTRDSWGDLVAQIEKCTPSSTFFYRTVRGRPVIFRSSNRDDVPLTQFSKPRGRSHRSCRA